MRMAIMVTAIQKREEKRAREIEKHWSRVRRFENMHDSVLKIVIVDEIRVDV